MKITNPITTTTTVPSTPPVPIPSLAPATLIIFGITGDLAHRKLLPALYHLTKGGLLPKYFRIVGISRRDLQIDDLLVKVQTAIENTGKPADPDALQELGKHIEIVTMDMLNPEHYLRLGKRLNTIEDEVGMCMSRLFYLAIPSQTFAPVVEQLGQGGLNKSCQHNGGDARLLIEKPFGYDLQSAHELISELNEHFSEQQIYRIDHYLAKETAQNILNFRFQNPIFKRAWDARSISRITITAAEQIDIEGRVAFYEQTGALRDLIQSHLLQLLALTVMDEPAALTSDEIHRQKLSSLQSIMPIAPDKVATDAVRGQYESYRDEVQQPDSYVETYAAIKLEINNERWRGVPIVLRTGKALKEKAVDITIVFSDSSKLSKDNVLTIRIQPNEGISLQLLAKKPGFTNEVEPVQMAFHYGNSFGGQSTNPDAYERVLIDAFRGDKTLFATSDEVLASWRIVENVVHEWAKDGNDLQLYPRGSWGPAAADQL